LWAEDDYGPEQNFMLNIIWYIHCNHPASDIDEEQCPKSSKYRFDYMLAMVVMFTWLKLIFFFRVSQTFGPLFKMMQEMVIDLLKFMSIWMLIITMFTCVGALTFGELKTFHGLYDVSLIYFESALGSWDFTVYD